MLGLGILVKSHFYRKTSSFWAEKKKKIRFFFIFLPEKIAIALQLICKTLQNL